MSNESSVSIKALDRTSVHRITSGQVVVDLQTAVKELVENSLDAGATSIDVRFREYGVKSIEVIDNGSGISKENYESLALKHHTSKLSSFEDLSTVRSFGFRGEALSSLCALSESVVFVTATKDEAPMGAILEFERSGKLAHSNGRSARQRGTTATITGLFSPLPVRRKELERNAKREFVKALSLLQAYALVPCAVENRGVRLTVSNQLENGKRIVQLQTDGTPSIKASVSRLWNPKQLETLVPLELSLMVQPEESLLKRQLLQAVETQVKVEGLISKFASGCGRADTCRQYFFINGRPCQLTKIQKAINESYKTFNSTQSPFIVANFILPTESCDINVSPDKRTIFIHSEGNLIAALKVAIEETFAQCRSTFELQGTGKSGKEIQTTLRRSITKKDKSPEVIDESPPPQDEEQEDEEEPLEPSTSKPDNGIPMDETLNEPSSETPPLDEQPETQPNAPEAEPAETTPFATPSKPHPPSITPTKKAQLTSSTTEGFTAIHSPLGTKKTYTLSTPHPAPIFPPPSTKKRPAQTTLSTRTASWNLEDSRKKAKLGEEAKRTLSAQFKKRLLGFSREGTQEDQLAGDEDEDVDDARTVETVSTPAERGKKARSASIYTEITDPEPRREEAIVMDNDEGEDHEAGDERLSPPRDEVLVRDDESGREGEDEPSGASRGEVIVIDEEDEDEDAAGPSAQDADIQMSDPMSTTPSALETIRTVSSKGSKTLPIDISLIESRYKVSSVPSPPTPTSTTLSKPSAPDAESSLSAHISKDDFLKMTPVGQFNKGFIIGKLAKDLFLIDQHAADEKYNFETLQQTTKIQSQPLIKPRKLDLSAADELGAMEFKDILKLNGFEINVEEGDGEDGRERVVLVAQPYSKGTVFDVRDLEEIVHLARTASKGSMVRSTKATAMFASRACRKSVMIGDVLTSKQMTAIVRHMATMDQPWNCPHGRPTMRHLARLGSSGSEGVRREVGWATWGKILKESEEMEE